MANVARLPRRHARRLRVTMLALLAVVGPGMVSGFADNDAGGITTYSIAGAQFGYALLWVLLASQLALMVTQEVGARLGLATGHGLSGLIRERFGVRWALFAVATMLPLGCELARERELLSRLCALDGITPFRWWINDRIVDGLATSVNTPTATSNTAGIAKNVLYASADASIMQLSSMNPLPARTTIAR